MLGQDRILALDIGASKLVVAEFIASKPSGLELINYAVAPLGIDPDSTADIGALRRFLDLFGSLPEADFAEQHRADESRLDVRKRRQFHQQVSAVRGALNELDERRLKKFWRQHVFSH